MAYTKEQLKTLNRKIYTSEEWELVKKYFTVPSGCLAKGMTDEEYLAKLDAKLNSLGLRNKAINKIGLDEDELKEIPPIEIVGFEWGEGAVQGHTGNYTSKYTVTYLFFSNKEVYFYSYTLDMLSTTNKEICEEYFYKDIVNIGTTDESIEVNLTTKGCMGSTKVSKGSKNLSKFRITVPGDKFSVPVELGKDSDFESKIRAAKAKIREKKEQ